MRCSHSVHLITRREEGGKKEAKGTWEPKISEGRPAEGQRETSGSARPGILKDGPFLKDLPKAHGSSNVFGCQRHMQTQAFLQADLRKASKNQRLRQPWNPEGRPFAEGNVPKAHGVSNVFGCQRHMQTQHFRGPKAHGNPGSLKDGRPFQEV